MARYPKLKKGVVNMIKVNGRELKKALSNAGKFIPRKSPLPALYTVKFTTHEGKLEIVATDIRDYFVTEIDAVADAEESFCVSYNDLKALEYTDDVVFNLHGDKIDIQTGNITTTLSVINPREFPILSTLGDVVWQYTFDARQFADALTKALMCVAEDETCGVLHHILVEPCEFGLFVVSTDTRQLLVQLVQRLSGTGHIIDKKSLVLSHATAKRLAKVIRDGSVVVTGYSNNNIELRTNATRIVSLTEKDNYPDWRRIRRENSSVVFTLNASDLAVVNSFPIPKEERMPRIYVTLDIQGSKMMLEYRSEDEQVASRAVVDISVVHSGIEKDTFAMNAKFLHNIAKLFGGEVVTVHYENNHSPLFIVASMRYVVMPTYMDT